MTFTDEGLHRIAEKAHEERTGARSLVGVCEKTFREFKYHLPHSQVRLLHVSREVVDAPDEELRGILDAAAGERIASLEAEFHRIAEQWSERNGIEIRLKPEAARLLSQKVLDTDLKAEDVFSQTFRNYEHGLSLIRKTRGISKFEIGEETVRDPETTLDGWIRAFYIQNPNPETRTR